jgi:hypothetical protein
MTPQELTKYIVVAEATSSRANHPFVLVELPYGYLRIGGGARTKYSGAGQLLTRSAPESYSTAWLASSKDHLVADPGFVTAYVIGIKPKIQNPAGGGYRVTIREDKISVQSPASKMSAAQLERLGYAVSGVGGAAFFTGPGRMLNALNPWRYGCQVRSKDHGQPDYGETYAHAIGVSVDPDPTMTNGPVTPLSPSAVWPVVTSSTSANLNWGDSSSNETGFEVGRCSAFTTPDQSYCSGFVPLAKVPANSSRYTLTGLSPGSLQQLYVRAFNSVGFSQPVQAVNFRMP